MPDADRLLNTLRRAVRAFRQTPGRKGRLVDLPAGCEVLVAGDLHGHVENFRRLLTIADLGSQPRRHLVLQELVHGAFRYPAGGDKSHQLLDLTAALKCQYPERVHILLGNHEAAQWAGQWIAKNDVDSNEVFRQGVQTAYGERASEIYTAYLDLFAAFALAIRTANRVWLSHSVPTARRLESFEVTTLEQDWKSQLEVEPPSSIHSLLWGRDVRRDTVANFLRRVDADLAITGHIPCPEGFAAPNDLQLILDCMGTPACYCLFSTERRVSHAELLANVRTL